MSLSLFDEYPIILDRPMARALGVNKALFIQQLHYWLVKSKHEHDGRKWVYNTYEAWAEQMGIVTPITVKRIVKSLRQSGVLLVGNFNKISFDKTNWYTLNYAKLEELVAKQSDPNDTTEKAVSVTDDSITVIPTIPETNTETNTKTKLYQKPAKVAKASGASPDKAVDLFGDTIPTSEPIKSGAPKQNNRVRIRYGIDWPVYDQTYRMIFLPARFYWGFEKKYPDLEDRLMEIEPRLADIPERALTSYIKKALEGNPEPEPPRADEEALKAIGWG